MGLSSDLADALHPANMVNLSAVRRSIESKLLDIPIEDIPERPAEWVSWTPIDAVEAAATRRELECRLCGPEAEGSDEE